MGRVVMQELDELELCRYTRVWIRRKGSRQTLCNFRGRHVEVRDTLVLARDIAHKCERSHPVTSSERDRSARPRHAAISGLPIFRCFQ